MKPIKFKEMNLTFAENQPPYIPLPAFRAEDGQVVTLWQLNWHERFKILFTGKLWFSTLTFNRPLQPMLPQVNYPFKRPE